MAGGNAGAAQVGLKLPDTNNDEIWKASLERLQCEIVEKSRSRNQTSGLDLSSTVLKHFVEYLDPIDNLDSRVSH